MSLSLATLIPGLLLLAAGALLLWNAPVVGATAKSFPRSRRAAYVLFGAGAAWFLYIVTQLTEADFGSYKLALFVVFAVIAVLSFKLVPDFLAVRGLAVLVLLGAGSFLTAAFMQWGYPQRLFMVAFVYAAIIAALFLAGYPYWLRDFFEWVFARPSRPRIIGALCGGYGLLLAIVSFTY
jgi:hypothetical protein